MKNSVQLPLGWAVQGEVLILFVLPERRLAIYKQHAWSGFLEQLEASRKTIGKKRYQILYRSLVGCAEECQVPIDGLILLPEHVLALLIGRSIDGYVVEDGRLLFQ